LCQAYLSLNCALLMCHLFLPTPIWFSQQSRIIYSLLQDIIFISLFLKVTNETYT
jgi:hypothetical protein